MSVGEWVEAVLSKKGDRSMSMREWRWYVRHYLHGLSAQKIAQVKLYLEIDYRRNGPSELEGELLQMVNAVAAK